MRREFTICSVHGRKRSHRDRRCHCNDVIISTMAAQITSLTIVYSIVYSGAEHRKHQSSASLAFVRGIHRWPVNSRTRARNAENVSIWWRHPVIALLPWPKIKHGRSNPLSAHHFCQNKDLCACVRVCIHTWKMKFWMTETIRSSPNRDLVFSTKHMTCMQVFRKPPTARSRDCTLVSGSCFAHSSIETRVHKMD